MKVLTKTFIEKTVTGLVIGHLLVFLYFLIFVESNGWWIVEMPRNLNTIIMFYDPIIFTIIALAIFVYDIVVNKTKNWYSFFIMTIAYLPTTIFIVGSYYRPAH
jgi:hypothetical protein